jgi:hypothetical protein
MVVYVVKTTVYGYRDHVSVQGVYSNLALAGRAAMQFIDYAMMQPDITITFDRYEEPWGYSFPLTVYMDGDKWSNDYGEIEIDRVTLNE